MAAALDYHDDARARAVLGVYVFLTAVGAVAAVGKHLRLRCTGFAGGWGFARPPGSMAAGLGRCIGDQTGLASGRLKAGCGMVVPAPAVSLVAISRQA
jgi:hypothetical protein